MFIVSIKRKGNNAEIITDDGRKLSFDLRIVYDNGLKKNDEFNEETFIRLTQQNIYLKTKDAAFRLLARRLHSFHELRSKLILKKYDLTIIDKVLSELKFKNLIDDKKFAEEYFNEKYSKKKIGINRIKIALIKKGISKLIINEVISLADDNTTLENAHLLAKKKINLLKGKIQDKKKIRSKIYSYLNMKGFESEIILKVLNNLNLDAEDENEIWRE